MELGWVGSDFHLAEMAEAGLLFSPGDTDAQTMSTSTLPAWHHTVLQVSKLSVHLIPLSPRKSPPDSSVSDCEHSRALDLTPRSFTPHPPQGFGLKVGPNTGTCYKILLVIQDNHPHLLLKIGGQVQVLPFMTSLPITVSLPSSNLGY